jgi:hypothetical protein
MLLLDKGAERETKSDRRYDEKYPKLDWARLQECHVMAG